jgi:hypothetical protein
MTSFRQTLRAFAVDLISEPGEHKRAEIAATFLDEHADLAKDYIRELAERQIADLVKEMCDEPDQDPLPIFGGFPSAITVGPGVVKATRHCTLNDLGAGLRYRAENVRHAQERLDAYRESMSRFDLLREGPDETVGEVADRLRANAAAKEAP